MVTLTLIAAVAGIGATLMLRGLFAPTPRLRDLAARAQVPSDGGLQGRLRHLVLTTFPNVRFVSTSMEADLRVLRKTTDQHVMSKLVGASALFVMPVVLGGFLVLFGFGVGGWVLLVAPVTAAVGFFFPDLAVRDQAEEKREEFLSALAAYLDLCRVLLGAADGPESALEKAASKGEGWAFAEIRSALEVARGDATVKHWDALGQLGEELDIVELREFAAAMSATATSASQPRTLAARANSLRSKVMRSIETEAERATERMDVPLTTLTSAFTIFLIYAALFSTIM